MCVLFFKIINIPHFRSSRKTTTPQKAPTKQGNKRNDSQTSTANKSVQKVQYA